MRLKALEVKGFKTFPDKTKLSFTEGITAVVGPNGSGKSNISDAIRWVLGEQSAKALRCSRMEDVIFNGTKQRKKTGYAEVTLSFDNSDRALQFDGDEVAVTRRYYRSGSSEYLINNTAVRLADIHELFMDTGLGRDGYSMIGQGKIDSIVATRGEDRREIFEEAAGISKFRYKKAEAEKRLDRTEENLVRLRDNVTMMEERLGPLEKQSEKAKAFLEYEGEKRGLEIALWLISLDRSEAAVKEQDDKLNAADAQYNDVNAALAEIQDRSERLYQQQTEAAARIDELRRSISGYDEQAASKRSQAAVYRNDIKHNESSCERIRGEMNVLSGTKKEIESEIESKRISLEKAQAVLKEKKAEEKKYTEELILLRSGETDSADKLLQINTALTELTGMASDAKISFMTSSSSITGLTERMETVENTIKAKTSQMTTLKEIIADYRNMVADCDNNIASISGEIRRFTESKEQHEEKCSALKAEADQKNLSAMRLAGKAKMLEDLERNLEGFTHSVKIIMRQAKQGTLSGIHGPVSRVIKTPSQYSTAIETALGAAMQNIVTTSDSDAKRAIAYLKQHDGGRATFLPMSTIKGRELGEKGLEQCAGFIGIASQLCSCDECYSGILQSLLGRIVIAENLDYATDIAKKYGYRFRVVTLDGQVVNTGGSLTGGSLAKNTGLLGRMAEIEKLRSQAAGEESKKQKLLEQLEKETAALQKTEEEITSLNDELVTAKSDKVKLEAEIRSRSVELESVGKALKDAKDERIASVNKMNELTDSMENARRELDDFRRQISENEEKARALTGSKDELVRKREKLTEKLQEIKLSAVTVQNEIDSANAGIDSAKARQRDADDRILSGSDELKALDEKNRELDGLIRALEDEADGLSEKASGAQAEIEKLTSGRLELEKQSEQLRRTEKEKLGEKERLGTELARLNERRSNLQKSYDDTLEKLWQEYELTRREAEQQAAKIEDQGKAQRRLSELKQKIRALGSVNVSAIEEFKELSERYEFFSAQVNDVERSRSELLHLINDLTKQMRDIFIERFTMINRNFSETFVELFGGGKASLSLSDPENVLTAGIDISVEPPGKIVSHIELLSGGEKALVAIALYFAIMKVSPAPFCVMDEIEAALDDVNVYRFAEYLRRMNDRTQFICITHRRGTMEEADVLYGVTMQDQGISKLLELKASELEQKLGMKA